MPATPVKTVVDHNLKSNPVQVQTPLKANTTTGTSTSRVQGISKLPTQATLKVAMEEQLSPGTKYDTAGDIGFFGWLSTQHVASDLNGFKFELSSNHSFPTVPDSLEKTYYTPLHGILNSVIPQYESFINSGLKAAQASSKSGTGNSNPPKIIRKLNFIVYDKGLKSEFGTVLKPDLLGISSEPVKGMKLHWADTNILLPIEVKRGNISELLSQTATYAQALFAHQANRLWVYAIVIHGEAKNHIKNFMFCRYDRSGLVVSQQFDCTTTEGLQNIARGIIALSTLDSGSFGIGNFITKKFIKLGPLYYIMEFFRRLPTVRGCNAEFMKLKLCKTKVVGVLDTSTLEQSKSIKYNLRSGRQCQGTQLEVLEDDDPAPPAGNISVSGLQSAIPSDHNVMTDLDLEWPDTMIAKLSWQTEPNREDEVIRAIQSILETNQGIAKGQKQLLGLPAPPSASFALWVNMSPKPSIKCQTDHLLPPNWRPENRELRCQIIETNDRVGSLFDAKGPKQLCEAIGNALEGLKKSCPLEFSALIA